MSADAITDLILRIADDELILAHRHSEWTGFGPLLEEDIAFSSIAQDKLGHSQALYTILHEQYGMQAPDSLAFMRSEAEFRCSHFVELPNGEYDFSLIRHLLFDTAEYLRYAMLAASTHEQLKKLSRKIHGELKYHLYHAKTWVIQLGAQGTEESKSRMQSALDIAWPYALGMFEPGPYEDELISNGVFPGETALQESWTQFVTETLQAAGLTPPSNAVPVFGGRKGYHTENLKPLLEEMTEVYRIDPAAEW